MKLHGNARSLQKTQGPFTPSKEGIGARGHIRACYAPSSRYARHPIIYVCEASASSSSSPSCYPPPPVRRARPRSSFASTAARPRDRLIAAVGGQRVGEIEQLGVAVLEVADAVAALEQLRAASGVVFAERDGHAWTPRWRPPTRSSTRPRGSWPGLASRPPRDLSTGSPETVIAVLDTGVGPHPDLGPSGARLRLRQRRRRPGRRQGARHRRCRRHHQRHPQQRHRHQPAPAGPVA